MEIWVKELWVKIKELIEVFIPMLTRRGHDQLGPGVVEVERHWDGPACFLRSNRVKEADGVRNKRIHIGLIVLEAHEG